MTEKPFAGIVFLDKPLQWSSRHAVDAVARLYSPLMQQPTQQRRRRGVKAGHAGTLDPLATGMLPVLLGEATRFADYGLLADKTYQVTIDLSLQTDTLDAEGQTLETFDSQPDIQFIQQLIGRFHGKQMQVPPQYSAIRIAGKRAHQLSRAGTPPVLEPREIYIHQLTLMTYHYPLLSLQVSCSKGTYIRSLARDIGAQLQCGGCVQQLRRCSTGGWPESLMCTYEQMEEDPIHCLQPLSLWLKDLPIIKLDRRQADRFVQGQRLPVAVAGQPQQTLAVYAASQLLGLGSIQQGQEKMVLHPQTVLPSAQSLFR